MRWAVFLLFLLIGQAAQAEWCGAGKAVIFAGLNWESGDFITAVLRGVLERGYGCRTEAVPGNSITLEQAVADNDVQIFAEEWVGRGDVWKRAAEQGKVRAVGHPFVGAAEGWYVPDYVVKGEGAPAPDLRDVSQLADPRLGALFRYPEQPTQGRFLNCPSGWTCEGVNSAKLQAYKLDRAYVDFRPGTGPAMDAAITAAYLQRQPLLFYSWSPSPIAGKLSLVKLREPPFSPACWDDLTSAKGQHRQGCSAPEADVAYGLSAAFADKAPDIVSFLEKANFPLDELNANLAAMAKKHGSSAEQAIEFLRRRGDLWHAWVSEETARKIDASLTEARPEAQTAGGFPTSWIVSIRQPVDDALERLVMRHGERFRATAQSVLSLITLVDRALAWLPWWLLVGLTAGLAYFTTRRAILAIGVAVLLTMVGVLGLWALMLQTLSLMLLSTAATVAIGLPAGVLCAKVPRIQAVVMPVLDAMQTMPGFVYLIPALMLFGLGKVPAMLATIIYSLPPMIRLTTLGVEQVDTDVKEAALGLGAKPWTVLLTVELPLARPAVMAGVNQTIMLALSMVVVASMIGARGLGEQVLNGIQTLDIGQGLEAGLGIVILAFVLDRVSQGVGRRD